MKIFKVLSVLFTILIFLSGCNQSKEEMLTEGRKLMQSGNTNGAIVALRNAIEKDPNYYEARFELAKAYIEAGKYDKAETELEKVSRQNPANGELTLRMAEVYLATERADEAIALLQPYVASHPQDVEALVFLGRAHAAAGELSESLGAYRLALEVDPDNIEARFGLARVLLAQGNTDAAQRSLQKVIEHDPQHKQAHYFLADIEKRAGNPSRSLEYWEKVIEFAPGDLAARYQAGLHLLQMGNLDQAEEHGRFLMEQFSKRPEGSQLVGLVHFQREEFDEAALQLSDSLSAGEALISHYFLGLTYFRQGKFDLALNHFNKVLDLEPGHLMSRLMLANTLLQQKHPGDAVNEARKAIEAAPENANAHNVLGTALLADGQVKAAMAAFDKAVELDPQMASAYMKKGIIDLSQGNLPEGEAAMIQAVAASPELLGNRLLLASYYARRGNAGLALKTLEGGLSGDPQDAVLLNLKAAILLAENRVDEAIESLEAAKKAAPTAVVPYRNLASIHVQRGAMDKALAQYDALLQVDPYNTEARLRRAAVLLFSGKTEKAREAFRAAAESGEPAAQLAYAEFLVRQQDAPAALDVLLAGLKKSPDNAQLLEGAGRLYIQSGEVGKGLELFRKLAEIDPDSGYPLLVAALLQNGETDEALKIGRDAVERFPDKSGGYVLLSEINLFRKDLDQAVQVLDEGTLAVEEKNVLQLRKVQIFERAGKVEDALAVYDRILEKAPTFSEALYGKGALLHSQGERSAAEELYKRALASSPELVPAWNNLAYLQLEGGGDPQQGLQYAARAFRLAPRNPAILDTLGFALYKTEKYEEARKVLEAAVQGLPEHPTVKYHLALAYLKLNENEKALGQLQLANATESFPEKREVQKLIEALQ